MEGIFKSGVLPPLGRALADYLGCPCRYLPPEEDDGPVVKAFEEARARGRREGFVPMLVGIDETLWECLVMNSDRDSEGAEGYAFAPEAVARYRQKMLSGPVPDGKAVLQELLDGRREEAAEDDMDWERDILGEMAGGGENRRFLSIWDYRTRKTGSLILAELPVKNPWEVFAYLPFGAWNECPDTPELMAAAKRWFERYGAVPAAMTHDELEFILPSPVPAGQAMELAQEHYVFCPGAVDQCQEAGTVGALADTLRQSTMWYFWWD